MSGSIDSRSDSSGLRFVGCSRGLVIKPAQCVWLVRGHSELVSYALEERSHWWTLAFAGACLLGSAYGFLQGAWPFGVVELVWAAVAVRRWRGRRDVFADK